MNNYSITNADYTREVGVDNGDGTGSITFYAADGTVVSSQALTGLPIEQPAPPDPLIQLAQAIVEATSLEDIKPVAQQILDDGIA